jgi:hypothetical protein
MSKTFAEKIGKNSMSVFPQLLFVLSRFQVFLSDGSSKTLQKTFYKKIASKSFYKKPTKIQTRFFLYFLLSRFRRFSVRGVQKHDKNIGENMISPGTFLASEKPTNHVEVRHCFLRGP